MTTQQYAQLWRQLGAEEKQEVPSSVGSSQIFMERISGQIGLHPVDTIGQVRHIGDFVFPNVCKMFSL